MLFTQLILIKYSLRRLYHLRLDSFNPYSECLKQNRGHVPWPGTLQIKYLKSFRNLHIYFYIKIPIKISCDHIHTLQTQFFGNYQTDKVVERYNVHYGRISLLVINPRALRKSLPLDEHILQSHFSHYASLQYPFKFYRFNMRRCMNDKSKHFLFVKESNSTWIVYFLFGRSSLRWYSSTE